MSLSFLCGLFGYTRQAYYKHLRRNTEGALSDTLLLERVGYYRKLMPRLGGRKLWHLLQQDGFPVSRDRLFTLLSETIFWSNVGRNTALRPARGTGCVNIRI